MSDVDEKPTPPVPPTEMHRYDDPDLSAKVLDREREDTPCPQCGGTIWLVDRQTGERVLASWPDLADNDDLKTRDSWPAVETIERCDTCGWRRQIA